MSAPHRINDADAAILAERLDKLSDRGRVLLLGWIRSAMDKSDDLSQPTRRLVHEFLEYFPASELEQPFP